MADEKVLAHVHESPMIMLIPLIILSVFAVFFGMFMHLIFIEINFLEIWSNTMYVNKSFDSIYIQQNVPTILKSYL